MSPDAHSFRPEALVGTTLDGRYHLAEHLATGGMGAVFRAEHVYMRKELALKVLRPDLSSLPDIAERFRREAEIAAALEHENIVRVSDFGRSPEGWLFLAMELLHGESLYERLRRGPASPLETLRVMAQMCSGLEVAHALGVVHRDLKPENVFLTADTRGGVKILDFGIAKITDPREGGGTQAGIVVGTPEYLSPEQATGGGVDGRSDLYAVGLIGWRMLAGRHPFQSPTARGLLLMQATQPVPSVVAARPELGEWPALVEAIARACEKDPAARPPSAAAMRQELLACMPPASSWRRTALTAAAAAPAPAPAAAESAAAPPAAEPPPEPTRASAAVRLLTAARARPWFAAAAGAGAILLIGLGALGAAALVKPDRATPEAVAAPDRATPPRVERAAPAAATATEAATPPEKTAAAGPEAAAGDASAPGPQDPPARLGAPPAPAESSSPPRAPQTPAGASREAASAERVQALITASRAGPGAARLKALRRLQALGAERRFDAVAAWSALLRDPACDVRRAAARRLGDLHNPAAVPALKQLADATYKAKGALGLPMQVPVCGADDADEALQRIARK